MVTRYRCTFFSRKPKTYNDGRISSKPNNPLSQPTHLPSKHNPANLPAITPPPSHIHRSLSNNRVKSRSKGGELEELSFSLFLISRLVPEHYHALPTERKASVARSTVCFVRLNECCSATANLAHSSNSSAGVHARRGGKQLPGENTAPTILQRQARCWIPANFYRLSFTRHTITTRGETCDKPPNRIRITQLRAADALKPTGKLVYRPETFHYNRPIQSACRITKSTDATPEFRKIPPPNTFTEAVRRQTSFRETHRRALFLAIINTL